MPPAIVNAANIFKDQLRARESTAMSAMAGRWVGVMRQLDGEIAAIARTMADRRARGLEVTPGYIYRTERYSRLLIEANQEFEKYADFAAPLIERERDLFYRAGALHGGQLIDIMEGGTGGTFDRLTVGAVQNIAGYVSDGSPLRDLLSAAWPAAIEQTTSALVTGVALGYGPERIAKMMNRGMTNGLYRSMVIARTETHRAYRENKLSTWRETGIAGFQRVATHDKRVCAACLLAEGEFIPIHERMAEHPQGRCIMIPCRSRAEAHEWVNGEEWLNTQPASTQKAILGKGRFEAWQAGKINLRDIPQEVYSDVWGSSLRARTLTELLGEAGQPRTPVVSAPIARQVRPATPVIPPPPSIDYATASINDMKTILDMEEWGAARFPNIRFDFTDLDVEAVRPTLRQFEKLATKYRPVADRLEYMGSYRGANAPVAEFRGAIAHASWDGKRIGLAPEYYGDHRKLKGTLYSAHKDRWLDADGSIEATLSHEFGHQIENWLMATTDNFLDYAAADGVGYVQGTVTLFNEKYKPLKSLSRYAITTNAEATASSTLAASYRAEGWAEAFAAIEHTEPKKWPKYVKQLNTLLETVADPSQWQRTRFIMDIPRSNVEERERAIEAINAVRKKLGL